MISTSLLISKSSSSCTNPLVTASITICVTVTFMFHSFFCSLARSKYSSLFALSFGSTLWSAEMEKSSIRQVLFSFFLFSFFFLTIIRSGCLSEIRWSVWISKSQRILCVLFSRMDSGLCIHHLFGWSNLNFLHSCLRITLLIPLCLVLYSLCTISLHLLIMWLIVSSLSPQLFCCVLSMLALT